MCSRARRRASSRVHPMHSRPMAALSVTVRHGMSMSCCGIYPTRPSSSPDPSAGVSIDPAFGLSSPQNRLSSVDFPHALGPTMVTNFPSGTSMSVLSSARTVRAPS